MSTRRLAKELPPRVRSRVKRIVRTVSVWPPVGFVRFGSLDRLTPLGPMWPNRRGSPVDRFYIERFLEENRVAIRGDVLEVGDLGYTTRFGQGVTSGQILHSPVGADPSVHGPVDLANGEGLPSAAFDCIVLPQTLLFIYDVHAAVATLHRALRPGGSVLATVPGITAIVRYDQELWGQYWSFTEQSVQRLFGDVFGPDQVEVSAHGNVMTSTAFLYNLAIEDVPARAFQVDDPDYPLLVTVRATKAPHPA